MLKSLILTSSFLAMAIGTSQAADLAPPPIEPEWTFTLAPYVWATGLDGKVGLHGLPEADIDVNFSDILEHFDMGLMAAGEARHGRFSIATDLLWVKLSDEKGTPHGVLADSVQAGVNDVMLTGAGAYSLFYGEDGNLDIMAGARLWSVTTDFDLKGGILDGVSASNNETWVDPVVGLKGRVNLGSDFYLTGWALIGGFGVSSDFLWDVMGGLGYQFSDSFSVIAGYRGLGVDYHNDGFVYDVTQNGPILGFVFRF